MNLLIHDLSPEKWEEVKTNYPNCTVISDNNSIQPCSGCFSCWTKTPGKCVIKDGYQNMGKLVHEADEVIILSRYTWGCFSGFVKNVIDRCLAYVLPHFEVINNETHHKKRYPEDKPFTFVFYGPVLTQEEKEAAKDYVTALCANFRAHVKEIRFLETEERKEPVQRRVPDSRKILILNPSIRFLHGNSAAFAKELRGMQKRSNEMINLMEVRNDRDYVLQKMAEAGTIVFATPLYVDNCPSQLLKLMEDFQKTYQGASKKIYVLANMGLYESHQLKNLLNTVRLWSLDMGFSYNGSLGISAGEMIGVLLQHFPLFFWPMNRIHAGMKKLAEAIDKEEAIEDIYAEPYLFPRFLYIWIANHSWTISKQEEA